MDAEEIMKRADALFESSGLTLEELGKRMGADPDTARMTAWQFLRKTKDPRVAMLLRFCAALEIPPEKLFAKEKKSRAK